MTTLEKSLPSVLLMLVAASLTAGLAAAENLDPPHRNDSPSPQTGVVRSETQSEHLEAAAGSSVKSDASSSLQRRGLVLSCSVVKWSRGRQKPVLTLACPGSGAADAVRVYIKLSWMELGDRPDNYQDIVAPPHTATMFRSNDDGAFVWLTIRPGGGDKAWSSWVSFNELVGLEVHGKDSSKD